jgi:hypothetical protein
MRADDFLIPSAWANASGLVMISKPWRERLIYTAMSVFVAWHTLAIVVAPAPDSSVVVQWLRQVLHPYLTLLRLDNQWNFYAPNPGRGHQLRYVVEDATGTRHTFIPTDGSNWFHPSEWWFRSLYDWIAGSPDIYGDAAAALLCRKHAALHPTAIVLMDLEQKDFSPADHLSGKHPLDSQFVTVNDLRRVTCTEK